MNEFAQVAEAFDLEPNEVIGKVMLDQRIGRSHWMVPGHDGKRGFGGHCFPKDINGYLHIARELGVDPLIGQAAWDKNLEVRPEQDWKEDKGRAVSNDED
jgi:UDPglucose 6-dehydrogenase